MSPSSFDALIGFRNGGTGLTRRRIADLNTVLTINSFTHSSLCRLDGLDKHWRCIAKAPDVEAGGNTHWLCHARGQPQIHRVLRIEPRLGGHQRCDFNLGLARFGGIAPGHAARDLVQCFGHLAHVSGRAHDKARRIMDHQKSVLGHDDLVTCHGDVAGS